MPTTSYSTYSTARFDRTSRAQKENARTPWPAFAKAWDSCVSLYDGLAAYRQYEHLQSKGLTRDAALRAALLDRFTLPKP